MTQCPNERNRTPEAGSEPEPVSAEAQDARIGWLKRVVVGAASVVRRHRVPYCARQVVQADLITRRPGQGRLSRRSKLPR